MRFLLTFGSGCLVSSSVKLTGFFIPHSSFLQTFLTYILWINQYHNSFSLPGWKIFDWGWGMQRLSSEPSHRHRKPDPTWTQWVIVVLILLPWATRQLYFSTLCYCVKKHWKTKVNVTFKFTHCAIRLAVVTLLHTRVSWTPALSL